MCKEGYTGTPLHRYLKNKLNSFMFKCLACGDDDSASFSYEKLIDHQQKSCPQVKVPCPLFCAPLNSEQPAKMFSRGEELKSHLKEKCPNMSVTCSKCDVEVAMRLKDQHDCIKALRGVIVNYSKIIS
jgi:hypothetical protein